MWAAQLKKEELGQRETNTKKEKGEDGKQTTSYSTAQDIRSAVII
jgi:hypothetical protein